MDYVKTGIILRTRPLTESSLIIEVLSDTEGRISLVAKGARRPKSPYAGKLDLFHEITFDYIRSKRSDLHTLRELVLGKTFPNFRADVQMLYILAYTVHLLEKTTEPDTPIPDLYYHFRFFIEWLHVSGPGSKNVFAFELKLLCLLGLQPPIFGSYLSAGTKEVANDLMRSKWERMTEIEMNRAQESEIAAWLARELVRSLDIKLKGRAEALENQNL